MNKRCLLGKRKTINSDDHYHDDNEETTNNKKKFRQSWHDPEPNGSSCLITTTKLTGLDARKEEEKEESTVTNPWMDDTSGFNCDIEYPIMSGNNATFVFDDEPLMAYLDSFILFEAFGCDGEKAYAQTRPVK